MIIDAEIARMVRCIRNASRSPIVPDDAPDREGRPGQHFLGFKETLEGLRRARSSSPLRLSRHLRQVLYQRAGEMERARAEVDRILAMPIPIRSRPRSTRRCAASSPPPTRPAPTRRNAARRGDRASLMTPRRGQRWIRPALDLFPSALRFALILVAA